MIGRPRALPAILLSLSVAVGAAGCSDADSGASPTSEGSDEGSADLESGAASGQPGDAGAYERLTEDTLPEAMTTAMYAQETVHMELRTGALQLLDADYRFGTSGEVALKGTVESGRGPLELLVVDGSVYTRKGAEPDWTQLPAEVAGPLLSRFESADPLQIAETFESGLDEVTYRGVDEVDGLTVHGYEVTLRDDFVAAEMGVPDGQVADVEYRLWLDEDHLLRRMELSAGGLEAEALLSRWGTPVSIEAPPADEVAQPPNG